MTGKRNPITVIDNLIFFFMLVFIASLTNSIFVNQLGYYGALILLLTRYFITKNNPFEKTGLEFALLWFIAAEIFSLIFSLNHAQSLLFVTRRFLLIPLIYVTVASVTDYKRAKVYFYTFIVTAVITSLIYIIFSYQYFIANLYSIKQSGPSLFQYPITSSEILGIVSVFLFAFLINEKGDLKFKLITALALFITVIALVATFKRTGWLGTGFGFFLIIFLKKEWKYLIPISILIVVLFLFQKNISEVKIFTINVNGIHQINSFETNGRAYDLTTSDGYYYISDYEDGLLKYKDTVRLEKTSVPSPIVSLQKWDGFYLGCFIDTRFISYRRNSAGSLSQVAECLPPGFTIAHAIKGNFLYTLDLDSGLTIFENPSSLYRVYRNNIFSKFKRVFADSDLVLFFSPDSGLQFFKLNNGIPESKLYSFKPRFSVNSVFYLNRLLYLSGDNGIKTYVVTKDSVHLINDYKEAGKVFFWKETDNKLIAADQSRKIFIKDADSRSDFKFLGKTQFVPASVTVQGDTLFASFVKRSRLLSIWDPYLPANSVRFSLWKAGWKMFLDHPVFGVGDIDLAFLYKQYKSKYEKEIQGHMHNNFVHILVTLGLFGFLAFCFLLYRLFIIDLKIFKEMKSVSFASSYALGTIAALSTVIVAGLTEMNFFDHEIMTLLWFTFGLNIAVYKHYKLKNM
jgi:O-antigen ligase